MPKKSALHRKLHRLYESGEITHAEFMRLLREGKKKHATRKQKAASLRNLRRACKAIDRKRGKPHKSRLEREVSALERDIKATLRHVELKEKLKRLKEDRRALRSALRQRKKEAGPLI